jgi:hypothetical protein
MIDLTDMPVPAFASAYRLNAAPDASIEIGRLATGGTRLHRAYTKGGFEGRGIEGTLQSGGETLLQRPDGVTIVEAVLLIHTTNDAVIRLIGTGYETQAPFAGTRMTVVIEADEDGPHAALTTRAFAAERPAGTDMLTLYEIE